MDRLGVNLNSYSSEETFELGRKLGGLLSPNSVVCFFGTLAAGKTAFVKGVVQSVACLPQEQVNSPTFVLLNIYEGEKTVYHFDLYRLKNSEEFLSLGFDDYWNAGGITCIEWSERIEDILPSHSIKIHFKILSENERAIQIEGLSFEKK